MKVLPPLVLADSAITSTVFETLPGSAVLYNVGSTYAIDAYVYIIRPGAGQYDIYKSKVAGNIGNTPPTTDTSNSFWLSMGTVYRVYNSATSYNVDTIVTSGHYLYQSLLTGTYPLTDTTKWQKLGPTNWYAVFDQLRNTQTVSTNDIVITMTPQKRIDSIAIIGLEAAFVDVELLVTGTIVYIKTVSLTTRNSVSWSTYLRGNFNQISVVELFDLPMYAQGVIRVTVRRPGSIAKVGGILIGTSIYIGETQYNAESNHLNFSDVERDKFGNITLIPRRSVPKVDLRVEFVKDTYLIKQILQLRSDLNGVAAYWSGLDDTSDPYFEPTQVYGIHKEFGIDLRDFATGVITLSIEEM